MNKTIGILAHVDAGKTTFSEQILYHTNSIRKRGRVDHKDAFLDSHQIERQRGITIFSGQGIFEYNGSKYYLVDTPGHIDFSLEMERSIKIMDYAIVIISAAEGVQAHTETVFRMLRNNNVPTFLFINKIDRDGSDLEKVLGEIKLHLTNDYLYFKNSFIENDLERDIIEELAERDENLFEKYIEDLYEKNIWISSLKSKVKSCEIYPCFSGSALKDIGIDSFLACLDKLTTTDYKSECDFVGQVYKVRYDDNGNRITYIKALSGSLKVKDEIKYYKEKEYINEKINQIRVYNGTKFETQNIAISGELFAVMGVNFVKPGDVIFNFQAKEGTIKKALNMNLDIELTPTLKSKVIFAESLNIKEVLKNFRILGEEEPGLNVIWDEKLKDIHIHVMGKIQLEILKEILKDRFGMEIEFGPCEILYKETIKEDTIGYGHFEPLGHYAEVNIRIEPSLRNSGIVFESIAHVDDLSIGNQNLVKTHIFERQHRGILCGCELTDIKITLINGRAHNKHTSGGDFREATLRAIRQGIEKVENILLEPYYKFKIEVENDFMGRVLSDIKKMNGEFLSQETLENRNVIMGRGPVKTFMDYSVELLSFTKGKGSINLVFDGYDECHNSDDVIENIGYNKDADSEYTSTSIFCSKGKGYSVRGDEAESYMHCL